MTRRLRRGALPLALTALLLSGCTLGRTTVAPAPDPTTVAQVRNDAGRLAASTKEAATLAVQARRAVQAGYDAGLVPRDTLVRVNNAAQAASRNGQAFIAFAETVTTDPSLRVTVRELLRVFDDLLVALADAGQSGAAMRAALAVLRVYLGGA